MKNCYKLLQALIVLSVLMTAKLKGQVIYTESFDGTTFVPSGWTLINNSTSSGPATWSRVTSGTWPTQSPHSGVGEAEFDSFSASSGASALVTPPFSLVNNTAGAVMHFWMYRDNGYNYSSDKVDVYYNTSASMTGATLLGTVNRAIGLTPTVTANGWYQYSFTIPNTVTAGQVYLILNATTAYGNNIFVDDVDWTAYPTPCTSAPAANSVVTPTYAICPGSSAMIQPATIYTLGGITYQWYMSTTSAVGPFTAVANATTAIYTTPTLTNSTYYSLVATCTNVAGSTTATAGQVTVSPVIIKSVPYHEDFEGIHQNNELPNCSWMATATPSVTQTYTNTQNQNRIAHSGSKFAAFVAAYINGTNYFFTNGIQLNAGVTYSASIWYTTDFYGYTNVTNLSIMLGTTQSSTGLVPIATASPAASPIYKALSGTFTVATSGVYYVAIAATTNGNYGTNYLSWDDLDVIVPCSLNSSTITLSTSSQTLCQGDQITLTAAGADTYSWSTGATGAIVTDMPAGNVIYSVVGTNTLSGCSSTVQSQIVTVNPSPNLFAYTTKPVICAGEVTNLVASGADTYTWGPSNTNNPLLTVTPTVSTNYVVIGANSYGCTKSQTVTVTVNPLPVVTASGPTQICVGEMATLTGGGAATYEFASNSVFIEGSPASVSPNVTTTYTVIGTSTVGCQGKTTITLNVSQCTGIAQIASSLSGLSIYPNPTAGVFTVELKNDRAKTVQVTDVTGRVILTSTSSNDTINMNMSNLANGIYYVKVQSDNAVQVIKIVKQ